MIRWLAVVSFWVAMAFANAVAAQAAPAVDRELPPGLQIPAAARPGPDFDAERATQAYLALLTPAQRAKSDAYFEGDYVLLIVDLIYGLAAAALILWSGWSRRLREFAQRITRRPFLVAMLYAVGWLATMFVLNLPWASYTGFIREHAYGLATQDYGAWFGDQLKELGVSLVLGAPVIAAIYAAVRRAGRAWWAWAGGITLVFVMFAAMIAPVYISPLFNQYQPLAAGPLRESILSLARANRVPAEEVYQFDASRQTTRISANVSGMFGTTRVSLNDNLLKRTSEAEIRAVMGHEMGHFVLNHGTRLTIYFSLILTLGYLVVSRVLDWAIARWGQRWGVADRADPAGLPAAMAILSIFLTVLTPVLNSIVRQAEAEADNYGLASAREPHGFAMAAMRLSTYRKIHPGHWEEVIFYDHPSGYDRVKRSMTWLAENQAAADVQARVAATVGGTP
jgi:STE24 endopeptidase